jgi:hypothetical protein
MGFLSKNKDILQPWKRLVGSIAPTIATAMGGPLAGTAVKFLAGELLGDEDATHGAIQSAIIGSSPENLAKIKEIDAKFKIEMERIGVDVYELEIEDRKDARALAKVSMGPQIALSVLFIGGYFFILYLLFSGSVKVGSDLKDISNILLGVMTANIPSIMAFWFGSSHGSKTKVK